VIAAPPAARPDGTLDGNVTYRLNQPGAEALVADLRELSPVDGSKLPDHYLAELRRVGRRRGYARVAREVYRNVGSMIAARALYGRVTAPITSVSPADRSVRTRRASLRRKALHHGDRRAAAQLCAQAASSSFACYLRSWSASRSITQGRKMSDWCAAFPARTPSATANAIAGIGVATSPQAKTPLTVVSFIASVL
jgi:hypothetical protein